MAEEIENTDSVNGETDEQELENEEVTDDDDLDAVKEKLSKAQEANKKLFARAKKGEGFDQVDGKWVKKPAEPQKLKPETKETPPTSDYLKEIEERFEQRDLDELESSDSLKQEIRAYAKLNNVSIKKAFKSDYIQFKVEQEDKNATTEEASLGGSRRPSAKKNFDDINPSKFDLATEEGKKAFKEWEDEVKRRMG